MVELLRLNTLSEERDNFYSGVVDFYIKMNAIEPLLHTAFNIEINSCPKGKSSLSVAWYRSVIHNINASRFECAPIPWWKWRHSSAQCLYEATRWHFLALLDQASDSESHGLSLYSRGASTWFLYPTRSVAHLWFMNLDRFPAHGWSFQGLWKCWANLKNSTVLRRSRLQFCQWMSAVSESVCLNADICLWLEVNIFF